MRRIFHSHVLKRDVCRVPRDLCAITGFFFEWRQRATGKGWNPAEETHHKEPIDRSTMTAWLLIKTLWWLGAWSF